MEVYTGKGNKDLARDPETNSILNVNDIAYEQYIASRESKSKKNQQIQSIEDEVSNMKSDINDIKSLLKELINGSR